MSGGSTYAPGVVVAGRYELETLVGEGAVGQVWVARSRALGSRVAVKLFSRSGNAKDNERFAHEAREAAQLDHPAIVRVFDFGVTDRTDPFLVMELLRGESLEAMLERGPLPPTRVVQICLPIIDALHTMHERGIVHRDIKPANLFVSRHDPATPWLQPKVIDFGLVKRWDQDDAKLTPSGVLVGSPAYMAPEQVKGLGADVRTDIWSLSVVIHELVAGSLPFPADTPYALFKAIVEAEPMALDVDPTLAAIVARGLAKKRDARWQSMRELGVALARWLVAQGVEEDAAGAAVRATWLARTSVDSITPRVWTSAERTMILPRTNRRRTRRALLGASAAGAMLLLAAIAWPSRRPNDALASSPELVAMPTPTELAVAPPPPRPEPMPSATHEVEPTEPAHAPPPATTASTPKRAAAKPTPRTAPRSRELGF
jgi:eukaryotic-like serine/threonine-protein kinase